MFYFIREIAQCLQLNEGEIYSDSFLQHRTRQSILGSDSSINEVSALKRAIKELKESLKNL